MNPALRYGTERKENVQWTFLAKGQLAGELTHNPTQWATQGVHIFSPDLGHPHLQVTVFSVPSAPTLRSLWLKTLPLEFPPHPYPVCFRYTKKIENHISNIKNLK